MPESKFMRHLVLLMPALCAASFSERAVTLAGSGHPALLFGLAALSGVFMATIVFSLRGRPLRPKPWCRIVPDPLHPETSELPRGLRLAVDQARVRQQDVWVELLPQFDSVARCRPYRVAIDTRGNKAKKWPRTLYAGAIVVSLPDVDVPRSSRIFQVEGPGSVMIRLRPKPDASSNHQTAELWHNASPPRRNNTMHRPVLLGASAGVLIWNLARFSPYAYNCPPPGLPVVLGVALAGLVAAVVVHRDSLH